MSNLRTNYETRLSTWPKMCGMPEVAMEHIETIYVWRQTKATHQSSKLPKTLTNYEIKALRLLRICYLSLTFLRSKIK